MGLNDTGEMLTWPRWLGRAAAFGLVVGLGAAMFSLGYGDEGDDARVAAVVGTGVVFGVGGLALGLWEQIRPTTAWFWRPAVWTSWWVWTIEIAVVGGLGYLAGTIAGG